MLFRSMEGRKIAFTGFLPQVDITGEGTLNLKEMDAWDGPAGQYRNHTYQGVFVVAQPLYTGGALRAQNKIAQADYHTPPTPNLLLNSVCMPCS